MQHISLRTHQLLLLLCMCCRAAITLFAEDEGQPEILNTETIKVSGLRMVEKNITYTYLTALRYLRYAGLRHKYNINTIRQAEAHVCIL